MAGMDPSVSTQPAPPNTSTVTISPSVPQTTPTLLPIVTGAASGFPSPPTRLRRLLIDLQVISLPILRVIGRITYLFLLYPALCAILGVIIMLLGNSVVSPRHASRAVAFIGVVGSLIFYYTSLCLFYLLIQITDDGTFYIFFVLIYYLTFAPVVGLIGSAVLLRVLDGIDISQGSLVGFIGGLLFFVIGCMVYLLIPYCMTGVVWVRAKWTENWTDQSHYGSRGDDPEIIQVAELQNLPGRD